MKISSEKNEEKFKTFLKESNFWMVDINRLLELFREENVEIKIPRKFFDDLKEKRLKEWHT